MDSDEKAPESNDELEPVSLRDLEMILKPGRPPPPIKKPEAPRPPRPQPKNASRTQGDLGVGDLDAFAVMSGSTPPPPNVAPQGAPKPAVAKPLPRPLPIGKPLAPKVEGAAATSDAKAAARASKPDLATESAAAPQADAAAADPAAPRPAKIVPRAPLRREPPKPSADAPKAADSALEDLRSLAAKPHRPKMDSVDFDDLLAMKDDPVPLSLSAPVLPLDLTLLSSSGERAEVDAGWEDPPPPPKKAAASREAADAPRREAARPDEADEAPASTPPPSSRGPSSRRAIAQEGKPGASSRPPKSSRGARTASKAPPARAKSNDVDVPIVVEQDAQLAPSAKRTPSVAPARRDTSSVAPQSMPPELGKRRSKLPIVLALGAAALAAIIYFATRGGPEPTAEGTASTPTPRTNAPTTPAGLPPTGDVAPSPAPDTTDAVATRSGNPTPATNPATNTTGTRPPEQPATTPTGATTGTTTTAPTTAPTTTPTSTPASTGSSAPAGEFNAGAASAALSGRLGAAAGCKQPGDPSGVARVTVTFAPSGRVTQASVNGPPFAGTKTGGCIAGAMRGASVPPFTGSPQTVSKTVNIP